jgi:cathepsin B
MVSCDKTDMGCNGGWLDKAWNFMEKTGVPSDTCYPYASGGGASKTCTAKCAGGEAKKMYKCKAGSVMESTTAAQMKSEISGSGPIETAFTVYQDFMSYKSGIYHHVTGGVEGGHAIKVLGWGVENGTDYWLCANSWGPSWGEAGTFRIKMGDCGIDSAMYSCTPDLATAQIM